MVLIRPVCATEMQASKGRRGKDGEGEGRMGKGKGKEFMCVIKVERNAEIVSKWR